MVDTRDAGVFLEISTSAASAHERASGLPPRIDTDSTPWTLFRVRSATYDTRASRVKYTVRSTS